MNIEQVRNGTLPCFVPGRRAFDLITPLGDVRLIIMYSLLTLKNTCAALTPPMDLIAYPFLDLNFSKALHNYLNAFLYFFFNMPLMTIQRCQAIAKSNNEQHKSTRWFSYVMCTPDASPGFNYLIAGSRRTGQLIDNWANALWLIVLGSLGLPTPSCAPLPLEMREVAEETLFGGNLTRIVGLTSGAYAITDGSSVQYVFFLGQITKVWSQNAWLGAPSLKHGIASVMYDAADHSIDANSGQMTMSMMGCRCSDHIDPLGVLMPDGATTRMQIDCSILRYDPALSGGNYEDADIAAPHFVPVAFSVPATALYMRCATTKIVVDSARFPLWRLGQYQEGGKGSNYDDPTDGEFTRSDGVDAPDEIDAVLWVIPACDGDENSFACQESLSDSGCFPYCMAGRKRGSRNDGLTLYSRDDWVNSIQLMDYDCGKKVDGTASSDEVEFVDGGIVPQFSNYKGVSYSNENVVEGSYVFSQSWDPNSQSCVYDPTRSSRVQRGTLITRASDIERYSYISMPEQPFAVAGETALSIVYSVKDGVEQYGIRVQRLFGQQGTGFVSLITVNSELLANAPCITLNKCDADDVTSRNNKIATIPYSVYSDPSTHNPAVMTKWGVIYAANPSYQMFSEQFRQCRKMQTSLGIQVLSSFGPTRLWRVDAFAYDDPATDMRTIKTGGVVTIPDGYSPDDENICGRVFNVRVSSMEYLNDQNIAVQVLRASPEHFNPNTRNFDDDIKKGPDGKRLVSYRTYFLNPENMLLQQGDMWPEDSAPSELGQGLLCPSQRRMPDFGSMAAEIVAAGLHAVRMAFEVLLTGPAVFAPGAYDVVGMGVNVNYGHSFLLNRGLGWLNFDPMFDSLRRAHQHFYNSFTKFGNLFDDAPYINQFMNGFALYNQDYTPLVTANMKRYLGAAERASEAVDNKITVMMSKVAGKNPIITAGLGAGSGMLNMAQYACRVMRTLITSVLLPGITVAAAGDSGMRVVHGLWHVIYETQSDYKTFILNAELGSCVGLQLMLGQSNPIAVLAGNVCIAGVMFKLGAIETALAFFVDLPMLGCLCTDSEQQDYRKFVMEHCYKGAPAAYQGHVLQLIQGSTTPRTLCVAGSESVQIRIRDAMEPFLAASYRASATLADTIDFMRFMWDQDAGVCRNYAGDGAVTAIIPDPVEFWRICGWTKTCRAKCIGSIKTFENAKESNGVKIRDVRLVTSQTTVESQFFNDMDVISSRSQSPFDILDIAEMIDCVYTCGLQNSILHDRCVAVLGLEYGVSKDNPMSASIIVHEYCVPRRLDANVWLHRTWRVHNSHKWSSDILQVRLLHQGYFCAKFSQNAFCSIAVLKGSSVSLYREDGAEYIVESYSARSAAGTRMTNIQRIFTLGNNLLLVHGLGYSNGIDSEKIPRSLCVDTSDKDMWLRFPVKSCLQNVIEMQLLDIPVCVHDKDLSGSCSFVLLIPTKENVPVYRCTWDKEDQGILVGKGDCTQYPLARTAVREAGLYGLISQPLMGVFTTQIQTRRSSAVLSSSLSPLALQLKQTFEEFDLFVSNHPKRKSTWLSVMRLDTRVRRMSYHTGTRVNMDITKKFSCMIDDCVGCSSRTLRTLCQSAQQCTLAKCIGTTVNLRKPLCGIGKVLADGVEDNLLQWREGWNLMSTMLIQSIAVASTGKTSTTSTVEAIDEMFTSQVCLQKDTIFDIAGTVTSFLNANIDMVDTLAQPSGSVGALFQPPKIHDVGNFIDSEYREAQRTMILAAVTRFLGNIGLGIVYPLLVARKMMICQSNDLMKIFSISGMTLTFTSARYEDAYDAMTGTCMTNFEEENVEAADDSGVNAALDGIVAWLGTIPFANYKHAADGTLSYCMGLIRGLQDMVQVSDTAHCKLRDASVQQQGQCACGDDAVKIPLRRALEGWQQNPFWCTGFLLMETPLGTPLYVFNPYTYKYLRDLAGGLDQFLDCIATKKAGECKHLQPEAPDALSEQGVGLLPVIARCHANYQAMQWDAGASKLYSDIDDMEQYLLDVPIVKQSIREAQNVLFEFRSMTTCMKGTLGGISVDVCLQQHLASSEFGLKRQDYFAYEEMTDLEEIRKAGQTIAEIKALNLQYPGSIRYATQMIAACLVFTGPSKIKKVGVDVSEPFRRCTDPTGAVGSGGLPCELSGYVWSSRSRNAVDVANMHSIIAEPSGDSLETEAKSAHQSISDDVLAAVELANKTWSIDWIELALFTSEGDWLHQAFDCAILGPYGRADLSPRDIDSKLPALEYFRDATGGTTRDFVLPCSGNELKGDFKPPHTCGSDVRRSIIKSFVRSKFMEGPDGEDALAKTVKREINELFEEIHRVFSVLSSLGCECNDLNGETRGSSVECCKSSLGLPVSDESLPEQLRNLPGEEKAKVLSKFVPSAVRDIQFTAIEQDENVGNEILGMVFDFIETDVFKSVSPATKYNFDPSDYTVSAQSRLVAVDDGMYQTTRPLTTYGVEDAFDETVKSSAFEICMGAISQVMFTLPLGSSLENSTIGKPTTLASMHAWDPIQAEPEGHFTALEVWVRKLVADARELSPLFWSHRLKHVASDSLVCTGIFDEFASGQKPLNFTSPTTRDETMKVLSESTKPGKSRGVYKSILGSLEFHVPDDLRGDDNSFRETNRTVWALGQIMETCFCGWDSATDESGRIWCKIPTSLCERSSVFSSAVQEICRDNYGLYWNSWYIGQGESISKEIAPLLQSLDREECPWNMVDTAAWGLLDEERFVAHWLLDHPDDEAAQFTSKDLLYEGRGGVRYMNARDVFKRGRDSAITLSNPLEFMKTFAQQNCEKHLKAYDLSNVNKSYADHFRDVLFPVAQGVPENRGKVFCLRYVVELATYLAMKHVISEDAIACVEQLGIVDVWKRKCHTQTKLLGFCALRGVYSAHRFKMGQDEATHGVVQNHNECAGIKFLSGPANGLPVQDSFVVSGSSCLAVYHSASTTPSVMIFDPCQVICNCHGHNSVPVEINVMDFISDNKDGVAMLDPLTFLSHRSRTLSMKWSSKEDTHWRSIQDKRDAYATNHEEDALNSDSVGLDIENLWAKYVQPQTRQQTDPQTHTPAQPWYKSSGPRSEDSESSCGGVSDWWPEAWEHPVGFHVTAPCGDKPATLPEGAAFENGKVAFKQVVDFRTFNNHFEYDPITHTMRYQHSKLRNETLMMNNAGASGMCRLNTYAMNMREQNNVRICTRMRRNVFIDYAVPILNKKDSSSGDDWMEGSCSMSPLHVPWNTNGTIHPRLRTSGLLPSWPANTNDPWPSASDDMLHLGLHADEHADSWTQGGDSCGMPNLFECDTTSDCTMAGADMAVGVSLKCINSVCMVVDTTTYGDTTSWATSHNYLQCTEHSHCSTIDSTDSTLLCSGEGRCVKPILEFVNEFKEGDVDISWHAKSCDPDTMDTVDSYGKSPWGRITGVFEAHGLCSYRNWYEYRSIWDKHCSSEQDLCTLSENTHWIDTTKQEGDSSLDIFATQKLLFQEAHRCDRDFEHFEGRVMCRPRVSHDGSQSVASMGKRVTGNDPDIDAYTTTARYNPLYQTYYREGVASNVTGRQPHHVKIAQMQYMSNKQIGFLSTEETFEDLELKPCADIPQCSMPVYTIQGETIAARTVHRDTSENPEYRLSEAVKCGAYGKIVGSQRDKCELDFAVAVPLGGVDYNGDKRDNGT